MNSFKYYVHGASAQLGTPIYALYQPVLDCFLFVTNNIELARSMTYIMSSRYSLIICEITAASNYRQNIMDNSCCENWSLTNKHSIQSAPLIQPVIVVDELQQVSHLPHDIKKEKQWILMAAHWINKLNQLRPLYDHISIWTMNILKLDHLSPMLEEFNNLENSVMQLLYLNTDFDLTDYQINELVEEYIQ